MTLPTWLERASFIAACLLVPIAWGWLVNWLFGRFSRRPPRNDRATTSHAPAEDQEFIDYSI